MRLEDWQKYIESQFVEEEPEEAPVAVKEPPPAIGQIALALDIAPLDTPPDSPVSALPTAFPRDTDDDRDVPAFFSSTPLIEEADTLEAIPTFHARRREEPVEEVPVFHAPVIPDVVSEADLPRFVSDTTLEDRPHFVAPAESLEENAEAIPVFHPIEARIDTPEPVDVPVFRPVDAPLETEQDVPIFHARETQATDTVMEEAPQFRRPTLDAEEDVVPRFKAPEPPVAESNADVPQFHANKQDEDALSPTFKKRAAPVPRMEEPTIPPVTFQISPDFDTNIPSFAGYLPPSRQPQKPEEAPPPTARHKEAEGEGQRTGDRGQELEGERKKEQEESPTTQLPNYPITQLPNYPKETPARRIPRRRARHARNVRPENVPSGLSAADLWATVPKHVLTLLELGRLEEEEIAQYSYKRPFQEKRRELIERLLDPILSLEDTARLLNVCPTTVRRYTNKGILTHYRKEPERASSEAKTSEKETRQRRFRLSDILAFLETQQAAIEADREDRE